MCYFSPLQRVVMSLVKGESPRLYLAVVLYIPLLTVHWSIITIYSMVNQGEPGKGNLAGV